MMINTYQMKSLISSILLNNAKTSSSGICSVSILFTTGVSYPYGNTCVAMVMCLLHDNKTNVVVQTCKIGWDNISPLL